MKFYKIIVDNSFIGAIHSGQFIVENTSNHKLYFSNEEVGQFVDYEGVLYRDYWMRPIANTAHAFTNASIIEIAQGDYDIFMAAIANNEEIPVEEPLDDPIVLPPIEEDITVEFMRESKIKEMSAACRRVIENGFDLELRQEQHHFSLDTQDQLNLISLSGMAQTQSLIPYHADGETCIFYTADEINQIVAVATSHKVYHTTYYNALKNYINSLSTIESIAAITYGTPIPDEYKSEVLRVIEQ